VKPRLNAGETKREANPTKMDWAKMIRIHVTNRNPRTLCKGGALSQNLRAMQGRDAVAEPLYDVQGLGAVAEPSCDMQGRNAEASCSHGAFVRCKNLMLSWNLRAVCRDGVSFYHNAQSGVPLCVSNLCFKCFRWQGYSLPTRHSSTTIVPVPPIAFRVH
jgi:hypothetical protein